MIFVWLHAKQRKGERFCHREAAESLQGESVIEPVCTKKSAWL